MSHKLIHTKGYLLVVDDSEIKEGEYCINLQDKENNIFPFMDMKDIEIDYNKKVIKKIIAHLPLNDSPILEGVDLLPPLEDEVERLAEEFKSSYKKVGVTDYEASSFIVGYNKAKEKYKYTEEDVINAYRNGVQSRYSRTGEAVLEHTFIQSLNLPKMPNAFECEIKCFEEEYRKPLRQVSITTPKGHTQWVGKYIY
jgi:hypothetical protein